MGENSIKSIEKKVISSIQKFAYTDAYYLLVGATVFVGWYFKSALAGFFGLIMLSLIMLVTLDDILPLIANIFYAPLMIYSDDINEYLAVWPIFIPLAVGIIIFFTTNYKHKFKFGKMTMPLVLVTFALLIGGAGVVSSSNYVRALPLSLALGIGVLAVYLIGNHFLKEDENRDYSLFFARIMMYMGVVVALETSVAAVENTVPFLEWGLDDLNLGWGNRNNVATILVMTGPMTVFMATKNRHSFWYLLLAAFQFIACLLTFTKWSAIFGLVGLLLSVIFALIISKHRKECTTEGLFVLAIAIIFYFCNMHYFNDLIYSLFVYNTDFYDRGALYQEAINIFKENWIVGAGMGYVGTNYTMESMSFYYFHSTLFQVMASMGIIGLICYFIFYAQRICILIKNRKNTFCLFVLTAWIGFEGFSLLDTGTFVPFPNMMLILVMTLIVERSNPKFNHEFIDEYNASTKRTKLIAFAHKYDDCVYER